MELAVADRACAAAADAAPSRALVNLLVDLQTLTGLLREALAAEDVIDAYLFCAGLTQIVEDYLERDQWHLRRAAARLRTNSRRWPVRAASAATETIAAGLDQLRPYTRGYRMSLLWLDRARRLRDRLAEVAVAGGRMVKLDPAELAWLDGVESLPQQLRGDLIRLPSSFRQFDQRPEDVVELGRRLLSRLPPPGRPVAVVGVRTSGSYLAPLLGAVLQAHGHEVSVFTLRPLYMSLPGDRGEMNAIARRGGVAVVCDDPPRSGRTLLAGADRLERLGFARDSIWVGAHLCGASIRIDPALLERPHVLVPWLDWAVHAQLSSRSVKDAMERLLRDRGTVLSVRRLRRGCAPRGHAYADFAVRLRSLSGRTEAVRVRARGVGLGFFGRHAIALHQRLSDFLPPVYGLERGVLYEQLPDEAAALSSPLDEPAAARVAAYVEARARATALPADPAERLAYRGADWQRCGEVLAAVGGRMADLTRPLAGAVTRSLLRQARPSVPDGLMELRRFRSMEGALLKSDFDAGPFTSADDHCFDAASDIAGLAAQLDETSAVRVRDQFERLQGAPIDSERWLLRSVDREANVREGPALDALAREKRLSRLFSEYYGHVLLGDFRPGAVADRICAVDLDGVLESAAMGFNAPTPAGVRALYALLAHGRAIALATGRSTSELVQRCSAYRAAGGVAEYGAVAYDASTGEIAELLTPDEVEALVAVRRELGRRGIAIDPDHARSVRAFRADRGSRLPIDEAEAANVIEAAGVGGRIRAIQGRRQTDFAPAGVDKARGLEYLLGKWSSKVSAAVLDMAVGDTAADAAMLRGARWAAFPANGDPGLAATGARRMRREAQVGLWQATLRYLDHPASRCRECGQPRLGPRADRLLAFLSLEDASGAGRLLRHVRLMLRPDLFHELVL